MLPLPCSIPNRNTAHSELPRFQPAPQLKPSNTAAPLYPALPTPNSEEAYQGLLDLIPHLHIKLNNLRIEGDKLVLRANRRASQFDVEHD